MAYFAELQSTPGFEVVPLGVVEEAIIANRVDLSGPGEARRLAKILGVDVVVVGAVTDFTEYYPPRIGLRVEWYTGVPGSTRSRRGMACRGGRRRKNSFRIRSCTNRRWRWRGRSSRRRRRIVMACA